MHDFRTIIGKLNFMAAQRALSRTTREFALKTGALFRGPSEKIRATIEGIAEIQTFHDTEAESWLDPDDVAAGRSGAFDACDLRHWMIVAEAVGVPAVPAQEILSLSEDELSAVDQKIALPGFVASSIRRGAERAFPEMKDATLPEAASIDPAAVTERLFNAMDDVSANAIVRSNISGPSTLKAFAGAGILEDGADAMKLDANLEVGPGWVRHGNRRRIDATDSRFVETFAGGHKPRIHYLARPWVEAARRAEGPDPHRHGTPFAGKGSWPMEWRVFVENGRVTGVACYYGWAGSATPENARAALEAAALAERMVSWMAERKIATRFMDLEIPRALADETTLARQHALRDALERFPRDGINCTLDFIEVAGRGMMFLEGGPAHTPIGGGHPCAFAGHGVVEGRGFGSSCNGVALKLMDHVMLGDPKTWSPGATDDRILSWEDARKMAARPD